MVRFDSPLLVLLVPSTVQVRKANRKGEPPMTHISSTTTSRGNATERTFCLTDARCEQIHCSAVADQ